MVESSALLKRRTPKGYPGFESLPHRSPPHEGTHTRDSKNSNAPNVDVPVGVLIGMPLGYPPTIFVSSTCYDLSQVRLDLKAFIEKLGYDAVISETSAFPSILRSAT